MITYHNPLLFSKGGVLVITQPKSEDGLEVDKEKIWFEVESMRILSLLITAGLVLVILGISLAIGAKITSDVGTGLTGDAWLIRTYKPIRAQQQEIRPQP